MIETIKELVYVNALLLLVFAVLYVAIRYSYLKVNRRQISAKYEVALFLFYFYFAVLLVLITPFSMFHFDHKGLNLIPFQEIFRYPFWSYGFFYNVIGNIAIYIPFGFFVSYVYKKRHKKHPYIFMSIMVVLYECTQLLPFVRRSFDVDDIILNMIGVTIGYLIHLIYHRIRLKMKRNEG